MGFFTDWLALGRAQKDAAARAEAEARRHFPPGGRTPKSVGYTIAETTLKRVQDALDTDETGDALVEVARNAHRAELQQKPFREYKAYELAPHTPLTIVAGQKTTLVTVEIGGPAGEYISVIVS